MDLQSIKIEIFEVTKQIAELSFQQKCFRNHFFQHAHFFQHPWPTIIKILVFRIGPGSMLGIKIGALEAAERDQISSL